MENDGKEYSLMLKQLLETWEKNDKARKENERELIHQTVNSLMLTEIQEINDRQDEAHERYERNNKKHIKNHEARMKKIFGK